MSMSMMALSKWFTGPKTSGRWDAGSAWRHRDTFELLGSKSIKVCSPAAQVSQAQWAWTLDRSSPGIHAEAQHAPAAVTHRRLPEDMYPNSQSVRHPAQALALSSQYIPPPYDFTGYHHVPGVADPSTWNSLYSPRDEYLYSFPGSSPSAPQVSYSPAELGGVPTDTGGGSYNPYNVICAQETFSSRKRPHEPVRASISGGTPSLHGLIRVLWCDDNLC